MSRKKLPRKKIICKKCNKEFEVIITSNRIFCSDKCHRDSWIGSRKNSILQNCLICNKEFYAWPSRIKDGKDKCCSKKCAVERMKVTSYLILNNPSKTPEGKKRISETHKGEKSHNWQGGITPLRIKIHRSKEYVEWRTKCFIRDNYTCVHCGQVGGKLEVDHIKSFSLIKFENNILTLEDAINCEELWNINNGRTLCKPCHNKTDNYGWKSYYQTFGVHPAVKLEANAKGRFGII